MLLKPLAIGLLSCLCMVTPVFGQDDPIDAFLNGTDKESAIARKKLLLRGADVIGELVQLKFKDKEAKRYEGLTALVWELKKKRIAEDTRASALARKLDSIKITIGMQNFPLVAVVDYIRNVSGLSFFIDPAVDADKLYVDLKLTKVSLRTILEQLASDYDLDYDIRYDLVYLGPPSRLWAMPKPKKPVPLTEEQKSAATDLRGMLGVSNADDRDKATEELRKLGPAVIPILEEGLKSAQAEVVARCGSLIEGFQPKPLFTHLPVHNHWRSQKLEGDANKKMVRKLREMLIDMTFESATVEDIVAFIRDYTQLNVLIDAKARDSYDPKEQFTLKTTDTRVGYVLELLTLPRGLDVKITDGVLLIYERKK